MPTAKFQQLADAGQRIYESRLRTQLEQTHPQAFVAIEPESGDYFLGKTLTDAMGAARKAHPQRKAFAVRVGHKCAIEIGQIQTVDFSALTLSVTSV